VLQKCTNQTQAHASGRVINDRKCIESKGTTKVNISVEDLVTCCKTCTSTNVCQSGKIDKVIEHWVSKGVVTGGLQDTNIVCIVNFSEIF
jgi:hypothetical protein